MIRYFFLFLCLVLLVSCAPKPKGAKVILLPQDNQETGAVSITTDKGEIVLDKPYAFVSPGGITVQKANPYQLNLEYENLFSNELEKPLPAPQPPLPPIKNRFTVFFEFRTLDLVPGSDKVLREIISRLESDPPLGVRILGYTDTVGSAAANMTLSAGRSNKIANLLTSPQIRFKELEIRAYGEHGLRVPTLDNTEEPRNRRVVVELY